MLYKRIAKGRKRELECVTTKTPACFSSYGTARYNDCCIHYTHVVLNTTLESEVFVKDGSYDNAYYDIASQVLELDHKGVSMYFLLNKG